MKTRFWKLLWFNNCRKNCDTFCSFFLLFARKVAYGVKRAHCTCVYVFFSYYEINVFIDVFQARTHEQTHSITAWHNQRQYEKRFYNQQTTPNHCQWQQLNQITKLLLALYYIREEVREKKLRDYNMETSEEEFPLSKQRDFLATLKRKWKKSNQATGANRWRKLSLLLSRNVISFTLSANYSRQRDWCIQKLSRQLYKNYKCQFRCYRKQNEVFWNIKSETSSGKSVCHSVNENRK